MYIYGYSYGFELNQTIWEAENKMESWTDTCQYKDNFMKKVILFLKKMSTRNKYAVERKRVSHFLILKFLMAKVHKKYADQLQPIYGQYSTNLNVHVMGY